VGVYVCMYVYTCIYIIYIYILTGVGTDMCMVTGETTVGKTAVPSTQSRLTVSGGTRQTKVAAGLANVCGKVDRQLVCTVEGGRVHSVECPVKVMFTVF
jgi:hypothetical protein